MEYVHVYEYTTNAAAFRVTSIAREGNDMRVTWMMGSGQTNTLQAAPGDSGGNYATNFANIFTITNTVDSVTNYLDSGAITSFPARYYRVRLVP